MLSREEFIREWPKYGSATRMARAYNISVRGVNERRNRLAKQGVVLPTLSISNNPRGKNAFGTHDWNTETPAYTPRINLTVRDGSVVIFSDAHFWPGIRSLAFEGLLKVIKEIKPKVVISNGDAFDGASISRHDPLGWTKLPRVIDELDATKNFLNEIVRASPKAEHIFVAGNHDSRFDRRLASEVSEFEEVPGMRLSDHLKDWRMCYAVMCNESTEPFYIVHNIRGGMYAPRNNVVAAGCTVYTGHLHSQKGIPVTTLVSEMDGVDCGMVADRDAPAFSYVSSRPTDWREGFAVQVVDKEGYRAPAELARVKYFKRERRMYFRGEVIASRSL